MTWAMFVQHALNGLTLGSLYALIAIGYTMVYGIVGMINFAHGDVFMIGGFIALVGFIICATLGIGWAPLAILLVLVVAMVFTADADGFSGVEAYITPDSDHRLVYAVQIIAELMSSNEYQDVWVRLANAVKRSGMAPTLDDVRFEN